MREERESRVRVERRWRTVVPRRADRSVRRSQTRARTATLARGSQSRQTHPRDRPEHRGEVVHLVRCALLSALGLRSALRIRLFGCRLLRRGCSLDRRTCVDAGVQPCNGSARVACASQCGTREVREAGKQVDERRNGVESSLATTADRTRSEPDSRYDEAV